MTKEFETLFEKLWEKANYPTPTNLIRPTWYETKPSWFTSYKPNYTPNYFETSNQRTYTNENGLTLTFDLPGFNDKNLKVEVTENTLTIQGKRYYNNDTNETQSESVYKTYSLTDTSYDYTTAKAEVIDGVLSVFFPTYKKETKKVLTLI
jgi:HSP20 family molecular chaperone IbpA